MRISAAYFHTDKVTYRFGEYVEAGAVAGIRPPHGPWAESSQLLVGGRHRGTQCHVQADHAGTLRCFPEGWVHDGPTYTRNGQPDEGPAFDCTPRVGTGPLYATMDAGPMAMATMVRYVELASTD